MAPTTQAILLTPIAPNGVFDRSLVIGPAETLRIEILDGSAPVVLERDGQRHGEIERQSDLRQSKSDEPGPHPLARRGANFMAERVEEAPAC